MVLKWADIGHLASPREVHIQWVDLLEEEMFRQVSEGCLFRSPCVG